jgi:hypothetical protein
MRTIIACLICLTLLALSISTIAQENQTAPTNQTLLGNNTTLGNNTSEAINASQENQTVLANQILPGNNTTLENNVSESINASQENQTALTSQIPPANYTTLANNVPKSVNASQEKATTSVPAIHVGMASTKPINALGRLVPKETNNVDVFGNKSTYNISAYSNTKPTYDISASYIRLLHAVNSTVKPLFNVEDRNPTTPFWTAPSDTSANTIEDVSVYNQSESVRGLSGYPVIMVPSNIA